MGRTAAVDVLLNRRRKSKHLMMYAVYHRTQNAVSCVVCPPLLSTLSNLIYQILHIQVNSPVKWHKPQVC